MYIQVPRRIYLEMLGEDLKEELEKKDALLSEPDSYDKFLIRKSKYINGLVNYSVGYINNRQKLKATLDALKVSYDTLNDLYNQKVEEMNTLASNVKEVMRSLSACINRTSPTNRMKQAQSSLAKLYNSLLKGAGV